LGCFSSGVVCELTEDAECGGCCVVDWERHGLEEVEREKIGGWGEQTGIESAGRASGVEGLGETLLIAREGAVGVEGGVCRCRRLQTQTALLGAG
jgi:hypothetical protein